MPPSTIVGPSLSSGSPNAMTRGKRVERPFTAMGWALAGCWGGEARSVCALVGMLPRRLRHLPERRDSGGPRVFLACSFRARLLGLALLKEIPADCALLLPRCSAVHTFGMRFPIDVLFLDSEARVVRAEWRVGPGRLLRCRGATEVLEWRSRS